MLDWSDVMRQVEPALVSLLTATLAAATAVITVSAKNYLDSHTRAKDSQAASIDLQNAQTMATINVQAAAQRGDLSENAAMKTAALQGTEAAVPDALKPVADTLVESAVFEKKQSEKG